ncbi:MAG: penicillin-binding protein 2 [Myxococcota bacterium]
MRWKLICLGLLLCALLGLAWVKAYVLQLSRGQALLQLSHRQTQRSHTTQGFRGSIYDQQGRLLAMTAPVWSLYAHPAKLQQPRAVAEVLSGLLQRPAEQLYSKLTQPRPFVWLAHMLTQQQLHQIRQLQLPGIGDRRSHRRFYPQHVLAGQLLGSVSQEKEQGTAGVELAFNALLQTHRQRFTFVVDAVGNPVQTAGIPAAWQLQGWDIQLTLDASLQYATQQALTQAVQQHQAHAAWAIVMHVPSGRILSMASVPSCNPNAPAPHNPACRNRPLFDAVELGSVFKFVPLAAALDAGVVTPQQRIFCGKKGYRTGKFVIHDIAKRQWASVQEIFVKSINTGTIHIAQMLGKERLFAAMRRFGFGQRSGLGLIEESAGRIDPPSRWGQARFANVGMGYGFTATSLQLLQAVAVVASGGVWVQPQLLQAIGSPASATAQSTATAQHPMHWQHPSNYPRVHKRVLQPTAAKQIARIMHAVTQQGSGKNAAIATAWVAGKTGTAEKVDSQTGRYNKKRNRSSFVGMASASGCFASPNCSQIVAVVTVDEPRDASYGGVVAAPVWRDIVEAALVQLQQQGQK